MVGRKSLAEVARKWQKLAALARRSSNHALGRESDDACSSSTSVAKKGHIFVYSVDGKRFMIPLQYLNSNIFRELFRMSEDEFGFQSDGPVTLPCDDAGMEHILYLLQCQISIDMEIKAALESVITNSRFIPLWPRLEHCQQQQIYGF